MSQFSDQFSQSNQNIFSSLRGPRLEGSVGTEASLSSTRSILNHAGLGHLDEVLERRVGADPIELGLIDDDGIYSPLRAGLYHRVTELFVGESEHLERHSGMEHAARRPVQRFDVRPIASCQWGPEGVRAHIFCCEYGEVPEPPPLVTSSNIAEYLEQPEARAELRLAIPSRAGLTPPDALSLIHPLRMKPREFVDHGEAGAVVIVAENGGAYTLELFWTEEAFIDSLNRVQEIGRALIDGEAVARAAMRRTGEVEIGRASAILSKLYENAAQVFQTQESPLFLIGIWGIAVFRRSATTFESQIGVVGVEVKPPSMSSAAGLVTTHNECFGVVNQTLQRDSLGFMTVAPTRVSRLPIADLPWYEKLPAL